MANKDGMDTQPVASQHVSDVTISDHHTLFGGRGKLFKHGNVSGSPRLARMVDDGERDVGNRPVNSPIG